MQQYNDGEVLYANVKLNKPLLLDNISNDLMNDIVLISPCDETSIIGFGKIHKYKMNKNIK